jgi:hypothetical protein
MVVFIVLVHVSSCVVPDLVVLIVVVVVVIIVVLLPLRVVVVVLGLGRLSVEVCKAVEVGDAKVFGCCVFGAGGCLRVALRVVFRRGDDQARDGLLGGGEDVVDELP